MTPEVKKSVLNGIAAVEQALARAKEAVEEDDGRLLPFHLLCVALAAAGTYARFTGKAVPSSGSPGEGFHNPPPPEY